MERFNWRPTWLVHGTVCIEPLAKYLCLIAAQSGLAVGDEVTSTPKPILEPIIQFSSEGKCVDRGSCTYVNEGLGIQH